MIKSIILTFLFVFSSLPIFAGEGMWLPFLLQQMNEKEMQSMGMKMSAEDIYSVNKGSLKDAIVQFGGGCTGEIISGSGLLLTNHHCGYGQIQSHSSLENNYVDKGFWAKSQKEELSNPGLTATFIISMADVSTSILKGVTDKMSASEKQSMVDKNMEQLKKNYAKESYQEILVRSFYKGNQYYLFVTETYRDVRLVGAPPSSIGNFGVDTDNWIWPRHTCDFSMFRIYADKNNKPADYSSDNVPFKPRHFLPISMDGIKEGDFTMVFGFPGSTNEYLPSESIKQITD
ncbi:MAG TPA: S46 family peptidase, partial [Saprospiraceae bacterium]|nr:S46 family peptidase [Saprospiraceae bacterium]